MSATDSLLLLFDETRQQRPPVYLADEWQSWLAAIGQVIGAFSTAERQWACQVLVASDLQHAMPGLGLDLAFGCVEEAVKRTAGLAHIHNHKGERPW